MKIRLFLAKTMTAFTIIAVLIQLFLVITSFVSPETAESIGHQFNKLFL